MMKKKSIHIIVLSHGIFGNPNELQYLQDSLRHKFMEIHKQEQQNSYNQEEETLLVHNASANVRRTQDGIAAGGSRLATEVNELVENLRQKSKNDNDDQLKLSISFVGYSLGGLYARYALSKIKGMNVQPPEDENSNSNNSKSDSTTEAKKESNFVLHPRIFCTAASPHLGLKQQTYVRLPRWIEFMVANCMRTTGRDLFGYTDVVERLATDPTFLDPLQKFQKRLLYANAYHTDFLVPTRTAAFLSEQNPSIRRASTDTDQMASICMRVETLREEGNSIDESRGSSFRLQPTKSDNNPIFSSCELAERLDSLGWTKVFCDVRESLVTLPLPTGLSRRPPPPTLTDLTACEGFSVADLHKTLSGKQNPFGKWHAPFAHSIIVASRKLRCQSKMNSKGQPLMDQLASELVSTL